MLINLFSSVYFKPTAFPDIEVAENRYGVRVDNAAEREIASADEALELLRGAENHRKFVSSSPLSLLLKMLLLTGMVGRSHFGQTQTESLDPHP